ncbi:MAG: cysteine peptidase family C39 domain-containing protein [Planctomycetales bacterium]|nr:cysteine peptidase family C39 domain-containing protein [Planctomycetales bacterium]
MLLLLLGFLWGAFVSGPAGWLAARRSRWVWVPVALVGLAGTVAFPILERRPDLLASLYPSRDFAAVDDCWFVPFAGLFLGVAARQVTRPLARRGLLVLAALVVGIGAGHAGWLAGHADVPAGDKMDADGVVLQTTSYTCGVAAAAGFLRRFGVPATEREMAREALVVPYRGTTMVKVLWAVRDALEPRGYRVRLVGAGSLGPGEVATPCLADVKTHPFAGNPLVAGHLVVLRSIRPDLVVVEDPARGLVGLTHEDLRSLWLGSLIVAERTPPRATGRGRILPSPSSVPSPARVPGPRSPAEALPSLRLGTTAGR